MFQVLRDVDLQVAEEALYHAGLRLYERKYFPEWRHWLPLRTSGILAAESIGVAAAVLEEIERRSGKPLSELDDDEVRPYSRETHRITDDRRAKERPGLGREAGERLLAELRREYGNLSQRAA